MTDGSRTDGQIDRVNDKKIIDSRLDAQVKDVIQCERDNKVSKNIM